MPIDLGSILNSAGTFVKDNWRDLLAAGGEVAGPFLGALLSNQGASDSRSWQEAMRASTYQVMVGDLARAGLNPALAFGKGSASPGGVPSGDLSGMQGLASAFSGVSGRALSSVRQSRAMEAEVEALNAKARTARVEAEIAEGMKTTRMWSERFQADLLSSQYQKNVYEMDLMKAQAAESNARTVSTDVNRMLSETDLPGARARQRFDETEFGGVLREFRRLLDALPSGIGSRGGRSH